MDIDNIVTTQSDTTQSQHNLTQHSHNTSARQDIAVLCDRRSSAASPSRAASLHACSYVLGRLPKTDSPHTEHVMEDKGRVSAHGCRGHAHT